MIADLSRRGFLALLAAVPLARSARKPIRRGYGSGGFGSTPFGS